MFWSRNKMQHWHLTYTSQKSESTPKTGFSQGIPMLSNAPDLGERQ